MKKLHDNQNFKNQHRNRYKIKKLSQKIEQKIKNLK